MSQNIDFWKAIRRIRAGDGRYEPEAYGLVMEALEFTMQKLGTRRHISATELLDGFTEYARSRYGFLAADVMAKWGIDGPRDVGRLVFQMVDAGVLSRQDSDRFEDFDVELNLRAAVEDGYFE